MKMSLELTVKYFSTASFTAVEYVKLFEFKTLEQAKAAAAVIIAQAEADAEADDAMVDTFYWKTAYLPSIDHGCCCQLMYRR